MNTAGGQQRWGWLLGEGEARGIALICLFAGLIMVVAATLAFFTRSYRRLTDLYAEAPEQVVEAPVNESAGETTVALDREKGHAAARHADAPPVVPGMPPETR